MSKINIEDLPAGSLFYLAEEAIGMGLSNNKSFNPCQNQDDLFDLILFANISLNWFDQTEEGLIGKALMASNSESGISVWCADCQTFDQMGYTVAKCAALMALSKRVKEINE